MMIHGGKRGASTIEYVILVGVVALAMIVGFTAFGDSTKKLSATQQQCVSAMGCAEGNVFPSAEIEANAEAERQRLEAEARAEAERQLALEAAAREQATLDAVAAITKTTNEIIGRMAAAEEEPDLLDEVADFTWGFAKGVVVDGIWGTVEGTADLGWSLVTDPVGTTVGIADGVWYVVNNPITVAETAWDAAGKAWDDDPGRLVGGIVAAIVPVQKVAQVTKVSKWANEADAVADAARIAEEAAAKAAEIAATAKKVDTTTDTAKAGEAVAAKADEGCPGGVCTNGACFGPGTSVATPDGDKPIETIAPGDLVMARDPETGETAPRKVERLFITPDREVLDLGLALANGSAEHLVVTPEHPFWREGSGFVPVAALYPGDSVRTADGVARVESIATLPQHITVYNFEVETAHTYFVGKTAAWVHNACAKPISIGSDVLVPRSDGTVSGGRVVAEAGDGKVVVEVRTADGSTGTKIIGRDQLTPRRAIGEEVGVRRSDGSTTIGKVILRHDDGHVTVQWEQNGQIAQKTVHERTLRDADDVTVAAPIARKFGDPYVSSRDYQSHGTIFSQWMPASAVLPSQGWKLHVSAGMDQSYEVADRILPELRAMGVTHKVMNDPAAYTRMTKGQAGKFITIYPNNPEQAAAIARMIDQRLGDIKAAGPVIDGERAIGSAGWVYARYGSFDRDTITNPFTGKEEPDIRGRPSPPWVEDPFTKRP
jgi:hypothetical protein